MSLSELITAEQAIMTLLTAPSSTGFVDVRSEGEWQEGHIEGFHNRPILNNEERHLVGTCYKQQGNEQATALGYQLTAAHKPERVADWSAQAKHGQVIVCCWRGGARSRIACEWLGEQGIKTLRVQGGYKAMRAFLRDRLLNDIPPLFVLSGETGTGKTLVLQRLNVPVIDLEKLAQHRGSAFGGTGSQPSQQTFENRLALEFLRHPHPVVVEDESRLIGRCEIPAPIKQAMYNAPVIVLTASIDERLQNTFEEYVAEPLRLGLGPEQLHKRLQMALNKIARRLGDLRHQQLVDALSNAFRDPENAESHRDWIVPLLRDYYDPQYHYAFRQHRRDIRFTGDAVAVQQFIERQLFA